MNDVRELIVSKVTDEAEAIRSFELVCPDGDLLPGFAAGAHIDVHTPEGTTRQYSILNDERERHRYVIAVLREEEGRGGSRWMHDVVEAGMRVRIGLPRNAFPLEASSAPIILIAGGIGITPILAMARSLEGKGKPYVLHYVTRSKARTPFSSELTQAPFAEKVVLYRGDCPDEPRFDAGKLISSLDSGSHIYLCGSVGFMDSVCAAVQARPDTVLHKEYFAAPAVQPTGDNAAFTLQLARSGVEVVVPSDKSIVEVIAEHGVECPLNCEQGICGTCLTAVISGDIDHQDFYLSAADRARGNQMLICVSRAKHGSVLVLDL
ncbi:PDR/VanB family oxidoreductase [Pseudomonas sp. MHK4]|jgi:vanillate O-demethylase ferredoxin subunit